MPDLGRKKEMTKGGRNERVEALGRGETSREESNIKEEEETLGRRCVVVVVFLLYSLIAYCWKYIEILSYPASFLLLFPRSIDTFQFE